MLTAVSGRYGNTVTYTYDDAGRKATEALTIDSVTYTTTTEYDDAGQVSTLTYPDGSEIDRTYSDRGQLATISLDSTTMDTRTYDDGGRMLTSTYNNGVVETRSYNNDNTLASISYTGAAIGNLSYGWDANKNKTSETITGTMSGYGFDVGTSGYDDEDRLINWERDDTNLDQSWSLSLVGDWNSVTENSSTQTRTHGNAHELLTAASQSITHDVKGNMTSIPAVLRPGSDPLALTWDFDNRLVSADVDNDSTADVTYEWDALGRRVARDDGTTNTVYVQNGQQTIADYTSGTAATSPTYTYVYASYIDEPVVRDGTGGLRFYHRTQQYSITALTDSSATIKERYAYDGYGNLSIFDGSGSARTSTSEGNRYTYTGREWDEELGLYHYRARMYDSLSGRFLGRDPIGFFGSKWALYHYVASQPLIFLDPRGLSCEGGLTVNSPQRSAISTPWSDRPMITNNGLRPWGYTAKCVAISCRCRTCASDDCCGQGSGLAAVDCTISIRFHIFLNLAQIAIDGLDPSFVYGHEQRHVRNYYRELERIKHDFSKPDSLPSEGCLSADDCDSRKRQRQNELQQAFDQRVATPNSQHTYPTGNPNTGVPNGGQPEYPPIGNVPTTQSAPIGCEITDLQAALRRN